MKTLKRIWKNLKWLFNNPPTNVKGSDFPALCDYCGLAGHCAYWQVPGVYTICAECQKKVYDSVLKID